MKLILGDCLDVLPTLADASVDAVVTDPPYGQSNEAYDQGVPPEVWRECYRVAGSNAVLVSFAGGPTYHRIASDIEVAGWKVRQMWGWVYRNGFITSAYPTEGFDRLAPAFDPLCFATKGKALLKLRREPGPTWHRKRNQGERCSWSERSGPSAPTAEGRWPRSIVASEGIDGFQYFILNPNSPSLRDEKVGHPNQKPLSLMEWIVSKLPGDVFLDPYAGSATTGVACLNLGHDFIGIECDESRFRVAERRIRAEQEKTALLADPA